MKKKNLQTVDVIDNTFKNNHDYPLHFLSICLVYQSRKNGRLLCPVAMVVNQNENRKTNIIS